MPYDEGVRGRAPTAPPSMISASEALQILNAAGIFARQKKAPAGQCRTRCYYVAGKHYNLGGLRQKAAEVQAAQAA